MSLPRRARPWLGLLVLSALAAPACAADEAGIEVENDLVYREVGDAELKLDLARPAEGEGPFPAIVVIHGGGWRGGDKADHRPMLAELARRGYVAISPQYRFAPKFTFPAQVHDVKAAVRWLRSHAKRYKVDPTRVGAMGFSAGGHLSLMLGVTDADDGLEGDVPAAAPSSRVQAVVNYFGPTDLAAPDVPEVVQPLLRDLLGGAPDEVPDVTRRASPVTFVTADDAPTLTFHGTKDPLVPHTQAVRLAEVQTGAGVPGRVELLVGAGHGWQGEDRQRTMAETTAFFDRHLKPPAR